MGYHNVSAVTWQRYCKNALNALADRFKLPAIFKNSALLRFTGFSIKKSQINTTLERVFVYKIICLVFAMIIILCVRYTNAELIKLSIISKPINEISLFAENTSREYEKNAALYRAVLKNIGDKTLKNSDEKLKLERIKKELPPLMGTQEQEQLNDKASMIAETYKKVQSVKILDIKTLILMLAFFWLPEVVLLGRWLIFGSLGVLISNNKILVQCDKDGSEYALPGGHVKIGESSIDSLIREYKEETGADIICERLIWVEECFWEWNKKKTSSDTDLLDYKLLMSVKMKPKKL